MALDDEEHPGDARHKHRHDLGHEDHGPRLAAGTTRAIQTLLGLWIALTVALVVYAIIDSAGRGTSGAPGSGSVAPASRASTSG